jgi:hypothetical protein
VCAVFTKFFFLIMHAMALFSFLLCSNLHTLLAGHANKFYSLMCDIIYLLIAWRWKKKIFSFYLVTLVIFFPFLWPNNEIYVFKVFRTPCCIIISCFWLWNNKLCWCIYAMAFFSTQIRFFYCLKNKRTKKKHAFLTNIYLIYSFVVNSYTLHHDLVIISAFSTLK